MDYLITVEELSALAKNLFPCFRSLFQGDHLGVEYALRPHEVLLQDSNLLHPSRRLLGHHLVPAGPHWEALIIDDYFCIFSILRKDWQRSLEQFRLPGFGTG